MYVRMYNFLIIVRAFKWVKPDSRPTSMREREREKYWHSDVDINRCKT